MSVREGKTDFSISTNVIKLPTANVWTYWVITQGGGVPFDVQIPHPIHLHGHDFYVLGAGSSAWTDADREGLNYDSPIRRDVAMLPTNGWLALAFLTNNPGAWLFHCHIVGVDTQRGRPSTANSLLTGMARRRRFRGSILGIREFHAQCRSSTDGFRRAVRRLGFLLQIGYLLAKRFWCLNKKGHGEVLIMSR